MSTEREKLAAAVDTVSAMATDMGQYARIDMECDEVLRVLDQAADALREQPAPVVSEREPDGWIVEERWVVRGKPEAWTDSGGSTDRRGVILRSADRAPERVAALAKTYNTDDEYQIEKRVHAVYFGAAPSEPVAAPDDEEVRQLWIRLGLWAGTEFCMDARHGPLTLADDLLFARRLIASEPVAADPSFAAACAIFEALPTDADRRAAREPDTEQEHEHCENCGYCAECGSKYHCKQMLARLDPAHGAIDAAREATS